MCLPELALKKKHKLKACGKSGCVISPGACAHMSVSHLNNLGSILNLSIMVISFFILFYAYMLCIYVLLTCALSPCTHSECPRKLEEGTRYSRTAVITQNCKSPQECQELNLGPLEEQIVLLTVEPSLQPLGRDFKTTFGDSPMYLSFGPINNPHLKNKQKIVHTIMNR